MINDVKQDALTRMKKSIEAFKVELSKIRTGRAHVSLLNHITVDFYGSEVPIGQAARVLECYRNERHHFARFVIR